MLAVKTDHRGKGIATKLVCMAIDAMIAQKADEVRTNDPRFNIIHLVSFAKSASDCAGNRDGQRRVAETLRKTGLPEDKTIAPVLS